MKITHLTTQLPGFVNKDTKAVIIHLRTNDIGSQANKAIQDINKFTQKMKILHNAHFYLSEMHPRNQDLYNTLISHVNSHIRDICSKLKNVDYMPTPVTKQHLSRGGIHLNDKGQQKLTVTMAEVFNNYTVTGHGCSYPNHHNKDIANVNNEVINDQVGEVCVLSWNINSLSLKMADPYL